MGLAWPVSVLVQMELEERLLSTEPAQMMKEEAMLVGDIPSVSGAAKYATW